MSLGPIRKLGDPNKAGLLIHGWCLEVVALDPYSPDSSDFCLHDKGA